MNVLCDLNLEGNLNLNGYKLTNFAVSNGATGWSGDIPIVKDIEKTSSGLSWTEGSITVKDGIITSVSKPK